MDSDRDYSGSAARPDTNRFDTAETIRDNDLAGIDLQALSQKVYALMKEELRIERERLGFSR